jgi:hypothetical protein
MTDTESLTVRISVLESLCVMTLGLYLANARNDPGFSKSNALLDHLQQTIERSIAHMPKPMRDEGAAVLKDMLGRVRQNLSALHGGPALKSH